MATIFPTSPAPQINDEYQGYRYNGTSWDIIGISLTADYQPRVIGVSSNEIGHLDGVTSAIQTQIDTKITASSADVLTNKTIGLGTGITSIAPYDDITAFFGQSNIAIYQSGVDKGGRINISSEGVITVANSGIGYISGIVTTVGGTRLTITVGGNYLTGTLAEFNAALSDGNFATESYVGTAVSNLIDAAPATLDTLNELAAALGDDANFASTVTTALAGKSSTSHNHTVDSLSNVVITGTPSDGQALVWDTTTSKWINETVSQDLSGYLTTSTAASTYQPLVSGVSDIEIGYLDGVTSAIQTQLDSKVADSDQFILAAQIFG